MANTQKRDLALRQLEHAAANLTEAAQGEVAGADWKLAKLVYRLQQTARWGHVAPALLHDLLDEYLAAAGMLS